MMGSLRDGINRANFFPGDSTISIKQIAAIFALAEPVSLQRLAGLLAPEKIVWNSGLVDPEPNKTPADAVVKGSVQLLLLSNGMWSLKGVVEDNGDGAKFVLGVSSEQIDVNGLRRVFSEQHALNENQLYTFQKDGQDLWICRNWDGIKSKGFTWSFQASWTMSFAEIVKSLWDSLTDTFAESGVDIVCDWSSGDCRSVPKTPPDGSEAV